MGSYGEKSFWLVHDEERLGKTATAREQCVKMATIDANQGFGNICAIEKEERALLEGHIRRQRMLIEECRKELCCSVQVPPQQLNVQDGTDN